MEIDKVAIFIASSSIGVSNSESIIKQFKPANYYVLINPHGYTFNTKYWNMIIGGDDNVDINNNSKTIFEKIIFQIKKIKYSKYVLEQANKNIPNSNHISIYYQHLEDIIANYFFYEFKKNISKDIYIVEDGIANYYFLLEKGKMKFRLYQKKVLSALFGIKFNVFSGDFTGIDQNKTIAQYIRKPEFGKIKEKSIQLPIDKISYEPINHRYLLLGQESAVDYYEGVTYDDYEECLIFVLNHIKDSDKNAEVLYKPHVNGSYNASIFLLKNYPSIIIINNNKPIESILSELKPHGIYSFCSSALFNIKIALNETNSVNIFAYPKLWKCETIEIFEKIGIINLYK